MHDCENATFMVLMLQAVWQEIIEQFLRLAYGATVRHAKQAPALYDLDLIFRSWKNDSYRVSRRQKDAHRGI